MLAVDSLNLMFQIKSLETNKWAAYWVANLHNHRDVGQCSWVATDTFPVQRDTYYQTSFRWRNIWALGRMGSFLRAHSVHRMVQRPYKDSGNHRLRPDKDPDLVGVYNNYVSHKSKLNKTTTINWKIQFTQMLLYKFISAYTFLLTHRLFWKMYLVHHSYNAN